MTRTKGFDVDQALEAAEHQFWAQGYEGTSMQDLEQSMGLKRTSIYNAFGNKRALYMKALDRYKRHKLTRYLNAISQAPTAELAIQSALNEAIELHFNPSNPGGCMIVLSLLENNQHDAETNAILERAVNSLRLALKKRFRKAVRDGEIPPGTHCSSKADEVVALITGIIVMAKASVPERQLREFSKRVTIQ